MLDQLLHNVSAVFCDFRFNLENVFTCVDSIDDGLLEHGPFLNGFVPSFRIECVRWIMLIHRLGYRSFSCGVYRNAGGLG